PGTTEFRDGLPRWFRGAPAPAGGPRRGSPLADEALRQLGALARRTLEFLAEVGMRDLDECLRALRDRLPLQVRDAVLRHHVHDVRARRRDDVARRERAHDPALALARALVGGREAHERLAPARRVRPAHELE